jgi:hypothetical protein
MIGVSFHSSYRAKFKDDKQQTAVRLAEVISVISLSCVQTGSLRLPGILFTCTSLHSSDYIIQHPIQEVIYTVACITTNLVVALLLRFT